MRNSPIRTVAARTMLLGLASVLLAVPLATRTEEALTEPAQQAVARLLSGGDAHRLDEQGVPRLFYNRMEGLHENPVYVCIYAYGYYQRWTGSSDYDDFLAHYLFEPPAGAGREDHRRMFFACADWLVRNLRERRAGDVTFYVWEYDFPWPRHKLEPPWVSGMAQGCGVEVLVKAFQESQDQRYLDAATRALRAFSVDVAAGGVTRKDGPDCWWYEEYASPGAVESRVLNGMEHALLGIHAYHEVTGDPQAKQLLKKGFQSLAREIPKYDTGRWTLYDQRGQIAKLKYHHINVNLTRKLAAIAENREIAAYAQRWSGYRSGFVERYFLWQRPLRFYSLLFGVNVGLAATLLTGAWMFLRLLRKRLRARIRGDQRLDEAGKKSRRAVMLTSAHAENDVRIFVKMARTLARSGYESHLVAPSSEEQTPRVVDGVCIHRVRRAASRTWRFLATPWRLLGAALRLQGDVYHFHDPDLIPLGLILKALGKRVIADVHEDVPEQILTKDWIPSTLRRPVARMMAVLERVGAACFDGVITATPHIARRFPAHKTAAIQNFPLWEPDELAPRPWGERANRIAYVGLLTPQRGGNVLAETAARLPENLHARLVIAGTIRPASLEERLRASPAADRLELVGWRSRAEVREILAEARLGVVTFLPEPNHVHAQPNKLFEYMAAGLPVVASQFPLWREIVEGAGCGLTVDPADPEQIAAAIQWLLEHPQEAEAMGRRGQAAVRDKFNWEREAEHLLDFYRRVLHEDSDDRGSASSIRESGDREPRLPRAA